MISYRYYIVEKKGGGGSKWFLPTNPVGVHSRSKKYLVKQSAKQRVPSQSQPHHKHRIARSINLFEVLSFANVQNRRSRNSYVCFLRRVRKPLEAGIIHLLLTRRKIKKNHHTTKRLQKSNAEPAEPQLMGVSSIPNRPVPVIHETPKRTRCSNVPVPCFSWHHGVVNPPPLMHHSLTHSFIPPPGKPPWSPIPLHQTHSSSTPQPSSSSGTEYPPLHTPSDPPPT